VTVNLFLHRKKEKIKKMKIVQGNLIKTFGIIYTKMDFNKNLIEIKFFNRIKLINRAILNVLFNLKLKLIKIILIVMSLVKEIKFGKSKKNKN